MEDQKRDNKGRFKVLYPVNKNGEKECSICHEYKKLDRFRYIKNKNLYEGRCKDCFNKLKREKYRKNPLTIEKEKAYQKEWISSGKSKEYKKDWRKKNKEHHLETDRKRAQERRINDPVFKLRSNIARRINHALAKYEKNIEVKPNKSDNTEKLLGCTFKQYFSYLTQLLKDENLADKLSQYEIDHIRPVSSFDLNDPHQQLVCFNFRNTRPILKKENIDKSDNYSPLDELAWVERMQALGYEGELFLKYEEGNSY